jgi:hypothetical protein
VNTSVAVAGIASKTAIILAAIWASRGFLMALVPQLRIAAPKEAPKAVLPQSADGSRPDAGTAPMSVLGGPSHGEAQ